MAVIVASKVQLCTLHIHELEPFHFNFQQWISIANMVALSSVYEFISLHEKIIIFWRKDG